jgi:Cytochrome P450
MAKGVAAIAYVGMQNFQLDIRPREYSRIGSPSKLGLTRCGRYPPLAGNFTISSTLQTVSSANALILALAMHPNVQKRAQIELDAVVGTNRLPCCADLPRLPYLGAILIELARWHTVAPLGIHLTRSYFSEPLTFPILCSIPSSIHCR